MLLYLIRHGQTDYNIQGIVQGGGIDSDLNAKGRAQAEAFYAHYHQTRFDAVYVSSLKRTYQTLAPWEESGYQLQADPAIDEFRWGWMEGKKPTPEMNEEFTQLKADWAAGQFHRKIRGGESPEEAWNRIQPFFERVAKAHQGQRILVCSHGRTSRIVLSQLLGYGMDQMSKFSHSNTGLNVLRFYPNGKVQAEKINDVTHLEKL